MPPPSVAVAWIPVTHLRPAEAPRRHRRSGCRNGDHAFGTTQHIGGGIARRVCSVCATVSIDLSSAYEMVEPSGEGLARRPPGNLA